MEIILKRGDPVYKGHMAGSSIRVGYADGAHNIILGVVPFNYLLVDASRWQNRKLERDEGSAHYVRYVHETSYRWRSPQTV
jgi:hypothetical protein